MEDSFIENKGEHIEKNVEELLNKLMIFVGSQGIISSDNILSACIYLMQIVEKQPKLKGYHKKSLVIKVFEIYFSKNGGDITLLVLLPTFIDTTINIEKGRIEISVNPEQISSCVCGILSCFQTLKNKNDL